MKKPAASPQLANRRPGSRLHEAMGYGLEKAKPGKANPKAKAKFGKVLTRGTQPGHKQESEKRVQTHGTNPERDYIQGNVKGGSKHLIVQVTSNQSPPYKTISGKIREALEKDSLTKVKFTKPPLILIFLKLEKRATNAKKMEKPKSKSAKFKKKQKQNKREKQEAKKERQKRKKWGNMGLSICICFCFFLLFRFAFCLLLFCFFPGKKQKKQKASKTKKQIEKATKMQMDKTIFPIFSPLLTFPCFPIYFASFFFLVFKFCFLIVHVFSCFFFFSSLKNIRTKGRGEHKTKEEALEMRANLLSRSGSK